MAAGDARRALSGLFSYDLLDHFYSFLLFRTDALLWLKSLLCLLSLVYFRDTVSTSPDLCMGFVLHVFTQSLDIHLLRASDVPGVVTGCGKYSSEQKPGLMKLPVPQ